MSVSGFTPSDFAFQALPYTANTVVFNVKAYGAFGDNVHDDTTPVQNAINAAIATPGGGIVLFPSGTYRVTALTIASASQISLIGAGTSTEIAPFSSGTDSAISLYITNSTNIILQSFQIRHGASRQSTAYTIAWENCSTCTMNNVDIFGAGIAMRLGASNGTVSCTAMTFFDCSHHTISTGSGCEINNGCSAIIFKQCGWNGSGTGSGLARGVIIPPGFDTIIMDGCGLAGYDYDLYASGNSFIGHNFWAVRSIFDASYISGVYITATAGPAQKFGNFVFVGCYFNGGGGGGNPTATAAQAVQIVNNQTPANNVGEFSFIGCIFTDCGKEGLLLNGCADSVVVGSVIEGCGLSGVYAGIRLRAVNDVVISSNRITQNPYGIQIDTAVTNSLVIANDLNNNTTGPITPVISSTGIGSSGFRLKNNIGLSYATVVTPPTLTASPQTLTNNYGLDAQLIVTGGTGVTIKVNSAALSATSGAIPWPAGATVTLTWSVAPTLDVVLLQ